MKKELDKKLVEKYPDIFADRFEDRRKTAMCWGFSCGDGWYDLIDTLCDNIQRHLDWENRNEEKIPQVVATQVKEKFGGLRFYCSGGDNTTAGMITMAEAMSHKICDVCGNKGSTGGVGWLRTVCEEHND